MHSVSFPVELLPEKGAEGSRMLGKREFWELVRANAVVGIGSWNRIKHFRLNRPIEYVNLRNVRVDAAASASFTIKKEANVFTHRAAACTQFKKPGDPVLSKSCL